MFKKHKKSTESTLDTMREDAMNAEDYNTVRKLNDIESEMESKVIKSRVKGIFSGYGSALAGFAVGATIMNKLKSRDDRK